MKTDYIYDNPEIFPVIVAFIEGLSYNREIALKVGKSSVTILKHLKRLEEKKFITSKKEKKLNITRYTIDMNKFFNYSTEIVVDYLKSNSNKVEKLKDQHVTIEKFFDSQFGRFYYTDYLIIVNNYLMKTDKSLSYQKVIINFILGLGQIENESFKNELDSLFDAFERKSHTTEEKKNAKDFFRLFQESLKLHNQVLTQLGLRKNKIELIQRARGLFTETHYIIKTEKLIFHSFYLLCQHMFINLQFNNPEYFARRVTKDLLQGLEKIFLQRLENKKD